MSLSQLQEALSQAIPGFDEDGYTQPHEPSLQVVFGAARKWLEPPGEAAIEAAAEAMVIADSSDLPSSGNPWRNAREPDRNKVRRIARAAVEAYRQVELEQ